MGVTSAWRAVRSAPSACSRTAVRASASARLGRRGVVLLAQLQPILSPSFSYLDGATGEVWDRARYVADLRNGQPTIGIDQVAVHVDGDVAVVLARSFTRAGLRRLDL